MHYHPATAANLGYLQKELLAFVAANSISHREAEQGNHAIHAKDAYDRAVIFLRLLVGETEWSDGYERKIDDCFEMNDGDEVVRHLLDFAAADPRINRLLCTHRVVGERALASWKEKYALATC